MEYENVPVVDEIVEATKQRLNEKQEQLVNIEIEIKLLFEDIGQQRMHITSIESRINSLRNELQRNNDLKTLSELQGIRQLHTSEGECPTCRQSISDSLITPEIISRSMTIDQNIAFVKEQIKLFEAMYKNELSTLNIKERKLHSISQFASGIREEIRALKTTLTSQNNAPSYAFIEAKFMLAMKIKVIRETRTKIDEYIRTFSQLAEEWNNIQSELSTLLKKDRLDEDKSKINKLQNSFQQQLSSYGFSSLDSIEDIVISPSIYLPEYEGFDLQIDLSKATSASDYIRVIWAYLLGLLEISRNFNTNHPGLLIMDEPRQQSTNEEGLKAFFNRASQSKQYGQQVIIATSETDEVLERCLVNVQHKLKKFDGKIISPI
jgi:predicted  nucleic acid-binding Zn-ribbon protein